MICPTSARASYFVWFDEGTLVTPISSTARTDGDRWDLDIPLFTYTTIITPVGRKADKARYAELAALINQRWRINILRKEKRKCPSTISSARRAETFRRKLLPPRFRRSHVPSAGIRQGKFYLVQK